MSCICEFVSDRMNVGAPGLDCETWESTKLDAGSTKCQGTTFSLP
jgi:hypothetical protein